jgi:glutaminyl-tRNA synthetase
MAVLKPLRVVIDNYPEDRIEEVLVANNPEDESAGERLVPFSREIYIEQDDFLEVPPKKFFRLSPGAEVRLRRSYIIKCERVVKNDAGEVVELHCSADLDSLTGATASRRVKGTIHWVSAAHARAAEVRLYDRLFRSEDPSGSGDPLADLNPDSLQILTGCKVEPMLARCAVGTHIQFERNGYFVVDRDATPERPVFNRTVTLKDSWLKIAGKS